MAAAMICSSLPAVRLLFIHIHREGKSAGYINSYAKRSVGSSAPWTAGVSVVGGNTSTAGFVELNRLENSENGSRPIICVNEDGKETAIVVNVKESWSVVTERKRV